jgi:opacity protein-like surface antigen
MKTILLASAAMALILTASAAHADDPFTGLSVGLGASSVNGTFNDTGAATGLQHIKLRGIESDLAVGYGHRIGPFVVGAAVDASLGGHGSLRSDVCSAPGCGPVDIFQTNADTMRFNGSAEFEAGYPIATPIGAVEPYLAGGIAFMRLSQSLAQTGSPVIFHEGFNGTGPAWGGGLKWAVTPELVVAAHVAWTRMDSYSSGTTSGGIHFGMQSGVNTIAYGASLNYYIPDDLFN